MFQLLKLFPSFKETEYSVPILGQQHDGLTMYHGTDFK